MPGSRMTVLVPMLVPMLVMACGVPADDPPARRLAERSGTPAAARASEDIIIEEAAPVRTPGPLPADAGKLPRSTRKHRFAGSWAETLPQCRTRAWSFREGLGGVTRPDGQRCNLQEVSGGRSRYRAIAWCTPAPAHPGQLDVGYSVTFTFNEAAQTMNADGAGFPGAGLVFCGTGG